MKHLLPLMLSLVVTTAACGGEWITMFNGKDLTGWKVSAENPGSFQVKDGLLVIDGPRAHLFYTGPDGNAAMRDFEFETMVRTFPEANSGVFFHTRWQERGWPAHGYEAQVNASHKDPRKTGSIYAVRDVLLKPPHADEEWFKYSVRVEGKRIVVKVNDKIVNEYTEPEDPGHDTRKLGEGTIAIQAHDPKSVVHFKGIRFRHLP